MRPLNIEEVCAMWLWGKEYAEGGLGAVEFYKSLSNYRKHIIDDFVKDIKRALDTKA
jgi:hypothetical protein